MWMWVHRGEDPITKGRGTSLACLAAAAPLAPVIMGNAGSTMEKELFQLKLTRKQFSRVRASLSQEAPRIPAYSARLLTKIALLADGHQG